MGLAGGAIQQQQSVRWQARAHGLEDQLPPAAQALAPPSMVDAGPLSQRVRQVTPQRPGPADPKHGLDKAAKPVRGSAPNRHASTRTGFAASPASATPIGRCPGSSWSRPCFLESLETSKVARPETGSASDGLARQSRHRPWCDSDINTTY
jgi:hypothetical protein